MATKTKPPSPGILGDIGHFLSSAGSDEESKLREGDPIAKALGGLASTAGSMVGNDAAIAQANAKMEEAQKAAKTKKDAPKKETQAVENQIADQGDWEKLAQGLVGQNQQLAVPVGQAISGELTQPAEGSAQNQALASIGLSPNTSASSWLNSEIAQGNANDSPMTQALNAYGAAYGAGQSVINNALSQVGQGNELGVKTAAEQPFLQQLSQHLGSEQYYTIPENIASQLPPDLSYALSQAGFLGVAAPKAPASATIGLAPAKASGSSVLGSVPTAGGLSSSGAVNSSTTGNTSATAPPNAQDQVSG